MGYTNVQKYISIIFIFLQYDLQCDFIQLNIIIRRVKNKAVEKSTKQPTLLVIFWCGVNDA